jgi:hypothetical protein
MAAFGLTMTYNSSSAALEVEDVPKHHSDIIEAMLEEISHFDDTTTYVDGVASFCVASFLDGIPNPIPERSRSNVLHALGIMKEDRFVHQLLMKDKNNKSWHQSSIATSCVYFGEICTHRGLNPDPDRKGRKSIRSPDEYHVLKAKGIIAREQLVTPNLEKVFRLIPEENLISAQPTARKDLLDLRVFKTLDTEEKIRIISELQEAI